MTPELHYYHLSEGVTAFSTTRHGGFSTGNYGEFNVNRYCGDDGDAIRRNRQLLCSVLSISDNGLLMPHQVHGVGILKVTPELLTSSETAREQALEGIDALMTDVKNVCIGVSTADCIPFIIYDPQHAAVCVVHAGWRGTVQRITRDAVLAMVTAYHSEPSQLQAVIGPGISLEAFEVGDEVYRQFAEASFPMESISRRMPAMNKMHEEKWHIDLWAANRLQLHATGLLPQNIQVSGICTYTNHSDFFSARRLGIDSGRILTAALLR